MRLLSMFALIAAFILATDSDARGRKGKRGGKRGMSAPAANASPVQQAPKEMPKKIDPDQNFELDLPKKIPDDAAGGFVFVAAKEKKPAPKPAPKEVSIPHVIPKGKIVEKKVEAAPKFRTEITHVPATKPPERKGGSWHWHRWHGWTWLPVGMAPKTILLEANYRLPAVTVFYETTPAPLEIICPHCGKPIAVYVH